MAAMNWKGLLRPGSRMPKATAVEGLPRVNYTGPLLVTILATGLIFALLAFLTLIAIGNTITGWSRAANTNDGNSLSGVLICGVFSIFGAVMSVYFLFALIKGVRDLLTPIYYTRGNLADKRVISSRVAGDWIGITASYAGPDLDTASAVNDEALAASVDRTQIVQTRNGPPADQPRRRRSGYLTSDRVNIPVIEEDRTTGAPGPRAVFRVDPGTYEALQPGEEVLVAHSRYLEHIYFVARLRNGQWETYPNRALI
jgi:hypothetical protein